MAVITREVLPSDPVLRARAAEEQLARTAAAQMELARRRRASIQEAQLNQQQLSNIQQMDETLGVKRLSDTGGMSTGTDGGMSMEGSSEYPGQAPQPRLPQPQKPPSTSEQVGNASGVATGAYLGSHLGGGAAASTAPATPTVLSVGGNAVPGVPSLAGPLPLGPSAGVAGGTALVIKGLNDLRKGRTDNSSVGKASRIQTGITTGGFSEIARFAGIGGGKNPDQKNRDGVRSKLQELEFLDDDWQVDTAKGNKFYFDDGSSNSYNVDTSNPMSGEAIALAAPLGQLFGGGDKKLAEDFTGYLANAAMSDASNMDEVMQNVQAFYAKIGVSREEMNALIDQLPVDDQTKNVYRANASKFNLPSSGQNDMDGATGGGSVNISFNNALEGSLKKLNAEAAAEVKKQKTINLMNQAAQPIDTPDVRTSTIRTGVEDLDNILQGVLQ